MINAPRVGASSERIAEAGRLRFAESRVFTLRAGRVWSDQCALAEGVTAKLSFGAVRVGSPRR